MTGRIVFNEKTEKTYCEHSNGPKQNDVHLFEMVGGETKNTKDGTVHYFLSCPRCHRIIDAKKGFK